MVEAEQIFEFGDPEGIRVTRYGKCTYREYCEKEGDRMNTFLVDGESFERRGSSGETDGGSFIGGPVAIRERDGRICLIRPMLRRYRP